MRIYVTPYDLNTKQCTAPSSPLGEVSLSDAAEPHYAHGNTLISKSPRLVLIGLGGGAGLAVSNYVISEGPAR